MRSNNPHDILMNNNVYTLRRLYNEAAQRLNGIGVESARHEALLLCRHFLHIQDRSEIAVHGDRVPEADEVRGFLAALDQRETRPLQYILGGWEFLSMELAVGEGVLIPREDTAALVEAVTARAGSLRTPRILDLCAGSGAVALGCAQALPGAECVCVELSDEAMPYLRENTERYGGGRVSIVRADVLCAPDCRVFPASGTFDVICSNPPYIPTGDIAGLSCDVRREPHMALDGGADGLDFYRAICDKWIPLLRDGGYAAFEIGIGQETDTAEIMRGAGLADIAYHYDISGHLRAIIGTLVR